MEEYKDFIATELLGELKAENERKDELISSLQSTIKHSAILFLCSIIFIIGAFLLYLNQYDFSSTITNSADGVYALIDSNGNTVASDLTPEELEGILDGASSENCNASED